MWIFQGFFSVRRSLLLCAHLFISALWSPAGKGLTTWLSFVVSNCEFVTLPFVSLVMFGSWLYQVLIFATLLSFIQSKQRCVFIVHHVYCILQLNSVQKFCCNGFSKFLLLCVILGPTSLWETCWCRPPLISQVGHLHVRAPGKGLIYWEKSWNWETHPPTKTIWHSWNALREQIWKHRQFHYNICEWSFQWSRSSWEIIKCDYTPYT